jgi:hypothetical protein
MLNIHNQNSFNQLGLQYNSSTGEVSANGEMVCYLIGNFNEVNQQATILIIGYFQGIKKERNRQSALATNS